MATTLENLQLWTKEKADESSSGYIETDPLNRAINQAYRYVHGKLVQTFEEMFDLEGTAGNGGKFNTVSGTQGYALPTRFKKLTDVEWRDSTSTDDNEYRSILKVQKRQPNSEIYSPPREGYPNQPFRYFVAGSNIYFKPVPTDVLTIRLWFVQSVAALTAGLSTVIPDDYDPLIAELAALDLLGTSGERIFAERFKLFMLQNDHLEETAPNRDQGPEVMVITSED